MNKMTEPAPDPIPDYLAQAFAEAVVAFWWYWTPSNPDQPLVDVRGELRSITDVCALVDKFRDRLPDEAFNRLWYTMRPTHLKETFYREPTYAVGALSLRDWRRSV